MSKVNGLVRLARGVAKHNSEIAKALSLTPTNGGSFHVESVEQLAHSCKEEKPNLLHHWVSDDGDLCIAATWYGNSQNPFITLYASDKS